MKLGLLRIWALVLLMVGVVPGTVYRGSAETVERHQLSSLLPKFEEYAEKVRNTWKVPGMAVAIVVNDQVVYAEGFGIKQVGMSDPVDPHTIFQIGSASKAFTTALVAMQVDAGKFQWTDRVVDHLPDFMMSDPWVTREFQVFDLMAQHSGLAPYAGDLQAILGFDREQIMRSLEYLEPVSSFRSEFAYVNNLFLVAAALVDKYTGATWEDNIEAQIFEPLQMNESSVGLRSFQETTNLAIPHVRQDEAVVPLGKDWAFQQWVYTYGPAGGINSNVLDMAQWLRLQLGQGTFEGKQLVSADNMNFVHAPKTIIQAGQAEREQVHPLLGSGAYYAQGWVYVYENPYPIIWHNGGTSGCKSVVAFVPAAGVGIVVLSNLGNTEVPEILAQWFFDHYFGVADKDWNQIVLNETEKATAENAAKTANSQEKPTPALSWSAYSGTYHNDVYGNVVVAAEQGTLTLTIGPNKVKTLLQHQNRDTFVWSIPGMEGVESQAYFNVISAQAETLTIEDLNKEGAGVFRRVEP